LTPVGGRELCEDCRGRQHPAVAQPLAVDSLLGGAFTLLWQLGWRVPALIMLADLPWAVLWVLWAQDLTGPAGQLFDVGVGMVFGPLAEVAIAYLVVKHVHGGERSVVEALKLALLRLPATVATGVLVLMAFYTGLLCCILPALIIGPALSIALVTAGLEGVGPVEAVRRSWRRTKGFRAHIFMANVAVNFARKGADWSLGLFEEWFWGLAFWSELSADVWQIASNTVVFVLTLTLYQVAWLPARMIPSTIYLKLTRADPDHIERASPDDAVDPAA